MTIARKFKTASALFFAAAIGLVVFLIELVAHGQSASNPATQPTVFIPVTQSWLVANLGWLIPVTVWVLANLATVLSRYPKAKGVVAAIRMLLGGLSLFEFKDGKRPGLTFKLPVMPPSPPPEEPKA